MRKLPNDELVDQFYSIRDIDEYTDPPTAAAVVLDRATVERNLSYEIAVVYWFGFESDVVTVRSRYRNNSCGRLRCRLRSWSHSCDTGRAIILGHRSCDVMMAWFSFGR